MRTYTVINTNSPLQLDIPMSQGIIDFAAEKVRLGKEITKVKVL